MILDFFLQLIIQSFLGAVFLGGLVGIGLIFLRVFKIEIVNTPLALALSFFISLCAYVAGVTIILLLVKGNSLLLLKVISLAYIICSYSVVGYFFFERSRAHKLSLTTFVKKYGVVLLSLLFIIFVFYLGAYKTSWMDEWLHRPIVKFFVTNGEFPLKNPYDQHQNFIQHYHYGLYMAGSAIQILTRIGVSESLDVLKISFVIASFLLFYGLLFEWSKRIYYSIVGSILLLLSGSSLFFFDGFSVWFVWGEYVRPMNYPLLFSLYGITWVNLPLTIAFMILSRKLFYDRAAYSFGIFNNLLFLLLGYYLISELFTVFLILCLFVLTVRNIFKGYISLARIAILSALFVSALAVGIYYSGGVIVGTLKNVSVSSLLSLRHISSWGYSSGVSIINPVTDWFLYLRNFLMEVVIVAILIYGIYRKKISLTQQPLMFFGLLVTFIVPFMFSTPMSDINLYKLTALGIILLHLLFFYYYANHRNTLGFAMVIVLFVFGSLPLIYSNYHVRLRDNAWATILSCSENDLCYDRASVNVLNEIEAKRRGIKYVLTAPADAQEVVDVVNAYAIQYAGILNSDYLKQEKIQYIFVTNKLRLMLNEQQLNYLDSLEHIVGKGEFEILSVKLND